MKRVVFFLFAIFLLSCEEPLTEKIEGTYDNQQPKKIGYYQNIEGAQVKIEEKFFHENGTLKMEGKLVKGKRDGIWKAYFNNGQLQSLGAFKNGVRTGEAKVYYANGKLLYEGQYENDKKVGHWKFYNENGNLVEEKDF